MIAADKNKAQQQPDEGINLVIMEQELSNHTHSMPATLESSINNFQSQPHSLDIPKSVTFGLQVPPPPCKLVNYRKQNVRLEGYNLFVTSDDFDIYMLAQQPADPEGEEDQNGESLGDNISFTYAYKDAQWYKVMEHEIKAKEQNDTCNLENLPRKKGHCN